MSLIMYNKEFDILKTKALKYVIYKKRTEYEVKTKFSELIIIFLFNYKLIF